MLAQIGARALASDFWERLAEILDYRIFRLGDTTFTIGKIIYLVFLVVLLFWITRLIKRRLILRLLRKSQMDVHAQNATATITGYVILLVGFMMVLQTAGIDLTTLNVLAGAVGVGIGLGLQEVANNFISGLIILFERPIRVGDRIQVGEINGQVRDIRARSTTVLTNDNIAIIVPNSKFISEDVVNWSYHDPKIRFRIPVGVSYSAEPREVEKALLEAADRCEDVLGDPAPGVWFTAFGDSALEFELRAWTTNLLHKRGRFISEVNYAIHSSLKEHGIEIPFPQRDLHVRSGALRVVIDQGDGTPSRELEV